MDKISYLMVPLVLCLFGVGMLFSKKDMFSCFIKGAENGLLTAVKLLPTLVALLTAIAMFNASGAAEYIAEAIKPVAERIGIPTELVPLVLIRPLSGGASTALIADVFEKYGADSFVGRCASVIAGSSDTLLYVISVYFGAVGVKKTGGSVPIALFVMIFSVFTSVFLCRLVF